jgi:hypothetical protein
MSVLENTNEQIIQSVRRQWRQRLERRREQRPIRVIDGLLADLEELHLAGRKRVPDSFGPRLVALNTILPEALRQELRSRITIVHLMDRLYEMQDSLLQRKGLPELEVIDDDDDAGPHGYLPQAS